MIKFRKKNKVIKNIAEYIATTGKAPTPTYSSQNETSHIIHPRGIIFTKSRKNKSLQF